MFRLELNELEQVCIPIQYVGIDVYVITEWDEAFKVYRSYDDKLSELCNETDGRYFLELKYDNKEIKITYIYYENTN